MKKKAVFVINLVSGTSDKAGVPNLIESNIDKSLYDYEVVITEYAGHASEIASRAKADGVDVVVAVGGDGTVNEVARAIVHSGTALGIMPCGSGNGLARHLLLPMNLKKSIDIINACEIRDLDYGIINGYPFFCTCGMGFDAFVSQKFAESGKRGPITYAENILREGLKYKPETYVIQDDNGTARYKAFLVSCANASQYGNNAYIAPHASMKDGLLDIVVIEPFPPLEGAQVCLQLFNGTLEKNQHVKTFQTNALHITRPSEGAVHCDGDPFITSSEIDIRIVPQQLRVVVNPFAKKVRQCNLQQSIPEWFKELTTLPPTLQMKTDNLLQLNRNLLEKLRKN